MRTSYSPPDTSRDAAAQWALWVALSAIGLAIGSALYLPTAALILPILGDTEQVLPSFTTIIGRIILFGLLQSIPYGIAQWLFLRSLRGLGLWTLATVVTYPLIALAVIGVSFGVGNVMDSMRTEPPQALAQLTFAACAPSYFYVPIGVAQWLLLRRHFERAASWIPASYAGWLLAILMLYVVTYFAVRANPDFWFGAAPMGALLGGVQATVTGVLLLSLRPRVQTLTTGA
jgi:hypothetical protein